MGLWDGALFKREHSSSCCACTDSKFTMLTQYCTPFFSAFTMPLLPGKSHTGIWLDVLSEFFCHQYMLVLTVVWAFAGMLYSKKSVPEQIKPSVMSRLRYQWRSRQSRTPILEQVHKGRWGFWRKSVMHWGFSWNQSFMACFSFGIDRFVYRVFVFFFNFLFFVAYTPCILIPFISPSLNILPLPCNLPLK